MKLYRITHTEILAHPVVRLTFDDGFAGFVDFSNLIGKGPASLPLADPVFFKTMQIGERGRSLDWIGPDGNGIDFCADALRIKAEEALVQARALKYARRSVAAE